MSVWRGLFTDTVTVHNFIETNEYGDAIFAPSLTEQGEIAKCRIEYKLQEILDVQGNKITSAATVFTDTFIPPLSIVFDVFNKRFTVKICNPVKGLLGEVDHYEVIL